MSDERWPKVPGHAERLFPFRNGDALAECECGWVAARPRRAARGEIGWNRALDDHARHVRAIPAPLPVETKDKP